MNLVDLKGHLLARQANYLENVKAKRRQVVLLEADLVTVRAELAGADGALQATQEALADVESALEAAKARPAEPLKGS